MHKRLQKLLQVWSTTGFSTRDLTDYAEKHLIAETRRGVMGMSVLLLILVLAATAIYGGLGLGKSYLYTYLLVAGLSVHIFFSARSINELKPLHMLGMTLLILSATAFVSIAHQTGSFTPLLFSNILLLFMVVPMVPWGLREAITVILLIYFMLTFSTTGTGERFSEDTLWILQFFMLAAGLVSGALVAFTARVRRDDIYARFKLEKAHERMFRLSNIDPLTGAWNRRFLNTALQTLRELHGDKVKTFHFAQFDVDRFKQINDNYGHDFGDRVLKIVSETFTEHLDENGFLIRMGGDEFALLMVTPDPCDFIAKVLDDIGQRIIASGQRLEQAFSMSHGLISAPLDREIEIETLYREADIALYESKNKHRQCHAGEPVAYAPNATGSWKTLS